MKLIKTAKDQYRRFKENPQNSYYKSIEMAMKSFFRKEATDQEINMLEDFYSRIVITSKALSIKDDKGYFPANYYVFMPIPVFLINRALRYFNHCGFLKTKDSHPFYQFCKQVSYPSGVFNQSFLRVAESTISTRITMENRFKMKSANQDGTINFDLSADDKFEEFLAKVYETIEKYDLPNTDACCAIVGNEISKGRNPINLKGLEIEKERDRK